MMAHLRADDQLRGLQVFVGQSDAAWWLAVVPVGVAAVDVGFTGTAVGFAALMPFEFVMASV
jgi:hypothetical protein